MSSYQLAKNLSMNTRIVSYLPSLSALLQRLRTYITPTVLSGDKPTLALASDSSDLLTDACFSLKHETTELAGKAGAEKSPNLFTVAKTVPLPSFTALPQHILSPRDTTTQSGLTDEFFTPEIPKYYEPLLQDQRVELLVQEAPAFLLSSFMELMPGLPELTDKLNVICLSEHTRHDMSRWCHGMCQEREQLTLNFINSAKEICEKIQELGFWADFIDPSSGQPYLGPTGTNQLMEIDDRMRHFGLLVEDLGCCKCVRHSKWGHNVFVGVIFTNAPADSTIMNTFVSS